jgi:hypothetical protein
MQQKPNRIATRAGCARVQSYEFVFRSVAVSILFGLGLCAPAGAHGYGQSRPDLCRRQISACRGGHHVIGQLHFYLDDLFPNSLGRLIFPAASATGE